MRSCFLEQISLFFYRLWTFFGWFILLQLIFLLFVIKRTRWALDRKKNKFEFLNAWHQKISLLSWEVNHFGKAFSRKIFEKLSLPLKPSKMMMIVSVSLRTKLTLVKGKKRKKKNYMKCTMFYSWTDVKLFFSRQNHQRALQVLKIFSHRSNCKWTLALETYILKSVRPRFKFQVLRGLGFMCCKWTYMLTNWPFIWVSEIF